MRRARSRAITLHIRGLLSSINPTVASSVSLELSQVPACWFPNLEARPSSCFAVQMGARTSALWLLCWIQVGCASSERPARAPTDGGYVIGGRTMEGFRGEVVTDPDGRPLYGTLAKDKAFDGAVYKAGTIVVFRPDGRVGAGTLAADTTVQGLRLRGGATVSFGCDLDKPKWCDSATGKRRLEKGTLAAPAEIDGAKYATGTELHFFVPWEKGFTRHHKYGLLSVLLSADTEIHGSTYAGGSRVLFDTESRQVSNGTLAKAATVAGVEFPAGSSFTTSSGKLREVTIATDTTLRGVVFKGGTALIFMGDRVDGTLAGDTTIDGRPYRGGSALGLFANGKVSFGLTTADVVVDGQAYRAGRVGFFDDGQIRIGTLAARTQINGATYEAGTELYFEQPGVVKTATPSPR